MKTSFLELAGRVIRARPYQALERTAQVLRFSVNHYWLRIFPRPNVGVGRNLRTLTLNAFKAERPHAAITVGDDVIVYYNCDVLATGQGRVSIGNNCIIGSNLRLYCKERVVLGEGVLLSWNVFIADYEAHPVEPEGRRRQIRHIQESFLPSFRRVGQPPGESGEYRPEFRTGPVTIGSNVWIGANVTILKGVRVGDDAVIGAAAVVTRDVPPRSVVAGNPARVLRVLDAERKA